MRRTEVIQEGTCSTVLSSEALEHGDQISITFIFEFADRPSGRLLIRLSNNAINQLIIEIRDIREFGPGPLQTGSKLF